MFLLTGYYFTSAHISSQQANKRQELCRPDAHRYVNTVYYQMEIIFPYLLLVYADLQL